MLNKLLDKKGKKAVLTAIAVAVLGVAGFSVSNSDVSKYVDIASPDELSETIQKEQITPDFNRAGSISPERRAHILYGDATGGGHLYGAGKPCKSEFPKHWSEDTVIKEIELIASNYNLNWEQQRNGYYVTEQTIGTIKVSVVKGRENKQVITAYPTNTLRNPCPANDN